MRQRFLLFFSYIGTNYKGMQTLCGRESGIIDTDTIQGILEFGLKKVLRISQATVVLSSRTDQGVHAIESAVHFDYCGTPDKPELPLIPEHLCQSLNLFLDKNSTEIRIRRIVQVPVDFSCRSCFSRTYVYRLAVCKQNDFVNCYDGTRLSALLPISLLNRCEVVRQPFDASSIFEASRIFVGTWNFKTFSHVSKKERSEEEESYIKTVRRISISRINSFLETPWPELDPASNALDFYDIHVEGSGFLRRQVRRMVGALIGIARGIVSAKDVQFMLENPAENNWNPRCTPAPAHGLFLKSVNYKNVPVIRGPPDTTSSPYYRTLPL